MKLRKLKIDQFKKFDRPVVLEGITDGLNIIAGPNEMGKSTILDALKAVVFQRHNSNAQPIKALQNSQVRSSPEVELTFELDNSSYVIKKKFLKGASATLWCPNGRVLEGEAAEEELQQLLQFDRAKSSGADAESRRMWSVFWVEQGKSFGSVELPDNASNFLHSALEAQVGEVLGGNLGIELQGKFNDELFELVTETHRRPRGKYKNALDQCKDLQSKLDDLIQETKELKTLTDNLAVSKDELNSLESVQDQKTEQTELQSLDKQREKTQKLEHELKSLQSKVELERKVFAELDQKISELSELNKQIASTKAELAQREAAHAEIKEKTEKLKRQLEVARKDRDKINKELESLEDKERRYAPLAEYAKMSIEYEKCSDDLIAAKEADKEIQKTNELISKILVTEISMGQIRSASQQVFELQAKLRAVATSVTIDFEPNKQAGVTIGDEDLTSANTNVEIVDTTTIFIPERGSIVVNPNVENSTDLKGQLEKAKIELQNELGRVSATSVEDAEEQLLQRNRLEASLSSLQNKLKLHAPDGLEALEAEYSNLYKPRQEMGSQLWEEGWREIPRWDHILAELERVKVDLDKYRQQAKEPQNRFDELQTQYAEHQSKLATDAAKLEFAKNQLQQYEERLNAINSEFPEDQLNNKHKEAAQQVSQTSAILESKQEEFDSADLPSLTERIESLKSKVKDRESRVQSLRIQVTEQTAILEERQRLGLAEQQNDIAQQLDYWQEESAKCQREVEVLDLLVNTLRQAELGIKGRILKPFLEEVNPYLQAMFGVAKVDVDDNFNITTLARESNHAEFFHQLSAGTQEQIATVVRLGFAKLLASQGYPATVILDDALVFSDDARIRQMFEVLADAAKSVQIIVLTCRQQLFSDLPGTQLALRQVSQ